MKRARSQNQKLKTRLGRGYREVRRKLLTAPPAKAAFDEILAPTARRLAPEVEGIAKGKVPKKYEFGVTASLAVTHHDHFVVGARALPGNPDDGHPL